MGRGFARYVVPYVAGLAPALLVSLTWSPSGDWTHLERIIRSYSAPIMAAELFTIIVALREGLVRSLVQWNWSWPVLAAGSILLVVATATALTAPLTYVATVLTAYWIVHLLFGISILHLCGRIFAPQDLVRAYMVGFAVIAVQFFLFLSQIRDWASFDWRYGLLAFNHIRHAGTYLAPIAAIAIGVMAISKRRAEWAWAFATASLAIGMSLWTGSRGAILAIAGSLAFTLLLVPAARSMRGWGGGLASMIVAAAVVSQVPAASEPIMGLSRTVEATASANVTTGRTTIWKNVIGAIRERPLFGYGEGQMRAVAPFYTIAQPHNVVLQVTLAWGVVGLLCVLTLAAAFARRAILAVRRKGGILIPPFMAVVAIGILSLYDDALLSALPVSIFAAFAGLIASAWRSSSGVDEQVAPMASGETAVLDHPPAA